MDIKRFLLSLNKKFTGRIASMKTNQRIFMCIFSIILLFGFLYVEDLIERKCMEEMVEGRKDNMCRDQDGFDGKEYIKKSLEQFSGKSDTQSEEEKLPIPLADIVHITENYFMLPSDDEDEEMPIPQTCKSFAHSNEKPPIEPPIETVKPKKDRKLTIIIVLIAAITGMIPGAILGRLISCFIMVETKHLDVEAARLSYIINMHPYTKEEGFKIRSAKQLKAIEAWAAGTLEVPSITEENAAKAKAWKLF